MISGDCHTIKTAEYAHHFLGQHDRYYIESFDFFLRVIGSKRV
jgi:hypothetical protein